MNTKTGIKKYLLAKEVKEKYIIPEMRDKVDVFVIVNEKINWYIRDDEAVVKGYKLCIELKET